MSWRLTFDSALDADLRVVRYELAAAACEAVFRFAESGEGQAYPVDIDASVWRLFVPGGFALLRASFDVDTLDFLRIIPSVAPDGPKQLLDEPAPDSRER